MSNKSSDDVINDFWARYNAHTAIRTGSPALFEKVDKMIEDGAEVNLTLDDVKNAIDARNND